MKQKISKFLTSFAMLTPQLFVLNRIYATTVSVEGMTPELNNTIGEIVSILFWIACVVCVGKLIHIGILFILTGADGKSKAKGAILPWIVGVAICATFATLGPAIIDLFYTEKDVLSY